MYDPRQILLANETQETQKFGHPCDEEFQA